MDSVFRKVTGKWLATLEVPLAADLAMLKLRKMMAWATSLHDGVVEKHKPLECFSPDEEPKPLINDSWARGSVPTRKLGADEMQMYKDHKGGEIELERQSNSSHRSSNTGTNRSKISSAGTGRLGTAKSGNGINEDTTGQIIELDEEEEDNLDPGILFDMLLKNVR